MTEIERNDYFYVCSLIEYIARETKNHRGYIVECIGQEGTENLLYDAEVNHCLSFEQVKEGKEAHELIKIFTSFISDEISDFNTDLYYQNPDYIECSYKEGKLLA